jgi:ubiquinone/menaquinone biosynthesis C-methylase UbiE
VAADGVALPFRDYLFDVVMADNVLEHLEHPQAVLQEIARSLKPDGAFVFL